jgi:hypothetical protein
MEKTMKNLTALALIIALPFVASAQRQTFNLPAYFATNVFLNDNTNTPLAARISAVEATSTASWATFPATADMNLDGFGATNVAFIGFDTDYTNGIAEGRLQWNTAAEKLEFGLVDGALTHKIGDATIMRVRAAENILKGQVVSASGQTGGARPNVVLADADSTNLIRRVPTGIALQNINNNASGYILTGGLGDAFDTTAFPTDVPLFLSTTAGGLTTNKPGYPLDAWIVGESVLSNALTGQFVVNIAPCKQWAELEARYVNSTNLPAGIVTTNNLSTIAGSGLGVTSNRLVVTNVASASGWSGFAATQDVSFAGRRLLSVSEIRSFPTPFAIPSVASNIVLRAVTDGGSQGSVILGSGTKLLGEADVVVSTTTSSNLVVIEGFTPGGGGFAGGSVVIRGGIGTGLGDGNVTISNGVYFGNAANLTNFPSSLLTVSAGNAAYWRITTAPTGATSSGSSGQMAVSGTNLFIYSPNALGVGTGRWGRVGLDVSW